MANGDRADQCAASTIRPSNEVIEALRPPDPRLGLALRAYQFALDAVRTTEQERHPNSRRGGWPGA
jgi:hypothetical protein